MTGCPRPDKTPHASRAGALAEVRAARTRVRRTGRRDDTGPLTAYRCPCGWWHAGNAPRRWDPR